MSKKILSHLILSLFILYLLGCLFIPQCAKGGYRPEVSHNPPEEIPPDSAYNLTISFEEENITSVYIRWRNVSDERSMNMMHRAGGSNKTWFYHIPPQGEEGEISYFFYIEVNHTEIVPYGSEKQPITVPVREEIDIFSNYRYLMILGIIAVISIILFEFFRRKVRSHMEEMTDREKEEEDKWRKRS